MAGKKSSENMTALLGAICEPGGVASTSGALSTTFFVVWLSEALLVQRQGRNAIAIKLKITNVNKINGMLSDKNNVNTLK